MRVRGLGLLKRTCTKLRNRVAPGALVLLYHRVIVLDSDPQWLSISPRQFEEHLQVLQNYNVMPLHQLLIDARRGKLRRGSIALTFDDGYEDNFLNARPLLETYSTPATIFVATQNLDCDGEFWWDTLERIFLQPGELPPFLRLHIGSGWFEDTLGASAVYSAEQAALHSHWNVALATTPTKRHYIYRYLCPLIQKLPGAERTRVVSELLHWSRRTSGTSAGRMMSSIQVQQLAAGGLIEIGAHTVTHPSLAELPLEIQEWELVSSKAQLEGITGNAIKSFSYPFGGREHYSEATKNAVHSAGFQYACSNFPGHVRRETDNLQIPRFLARNWSAETFDAQLQLWYRGAF